MGLGRQVNYITINWNNLGREIMLLKKYYVERHGLLKQKLSINLNELIEYFTMAYKYFYNKGYFKCAIEGVWHQIPYTNNEEQIMAPTFAPSPEVFLQTVYRIIKFGLYMNMQNIIRKRFYLL